MKKALLFSLIGVFAIAAAAPYLSVDALMKSKAKFDKKDVTVRGKVDKFAAKTSKKGNLYTTFMLKGEKISVSVYMNAHLPKPLKNGDIVEVKGNFTLKKTVGTATFENEIDISKKDGKKYGVTAVK